MITIDGKEYTKEIMSDKQIQLFGIISSLSNKKQEHIQKAEQKEILIQHYITKFKEVTSKKEKT